ncbi:MAG: type I polyketide synthase, partial [Pseudonocardiaceae bacterium]
WKTLLTPPHPPLNLPTYPFQHERFWLETVPTARTSTSTTLAHPLLGALLDLPGAEESVFTGRLSAGTHSWLTDHTLLDTVIVPGTAFLELVVRAGEELGCDRVDELINEVPLVLPAAQSGVLLQVTVGRAEKEGRRTVTVYSRPDDAAPDVAWTRHLEGVLAADRKSPSFDFSAWPPIGAVPLEVDGFYADLVEAGYGYGPAFRGLRAAWRRDDELFVEVALSAEQQPHAGEFSVHPALLDAVLQAIILGGLEDRVEDQVRVPFAWRGIQKWSSGASRLRGRLVSDGNGGVAVQLADTDGIPVAQIESLLSRPVTADRLGVDRLGVGGWLFGVEWVRHEVCGVGDGAVRLCEVGEGDVRVVVSRVLGVVQEFLRDSGLSRLVVVTRGVVGPGCGDPVGAAVWGLVRSAQLEEPGRIVLVDTDDGDLSRSVFSVVAVGDEPQVVVRGGVVFVPRLKRIIESVSPRCRLDPEGTVLITGGTGALGMVLARHLVAEYGVRRLLLVGRAGGSVDFGELEVDVEVVACDVADRDAVAAVLDRIPAEHPLTGVVHAAGVLDDGVISTLTPERLDRVFGPKVDGALNLHELTRDTDLAMFVLFSSAAATLGSPGQGNYAAANGFLDGLAHRRNAEGLPAISLAWGPWDSGMAAGLVQRGGLKPLISAEGLALWDIALRSGCPVVAPMHLDMSVAAVDGVPSLLHELIRPKRPEVKVSAGADEPLPRRLHRLPGSERHRALLDLVRTEALSVLGRPTTDVLSADQAFREVGFDSLTAVELRNRLNGAMGVRLPVTVVFDHPTPHDLASRMKEELFPDAPPDACEKEIRKALATVPFDRLKEAGVVDVLLRLARTGTDAPTPRGDDEADLLDTMDAADLVRRALSGNER